MGKVTPLDMAQLVYEYEHCTRTFPQDLALHLRHGWVISTPTMFLMGRPVERFADPAEILNPAHRFDNPDTWLVWLAAGAPPWECIKHMPHFLQYVGWERHNKLRFYNTNLLSSRAQARTPAFSLR